MKELGIENPITNPSEFKTKGECLAECANQRLLSSLMSETVSCSHPTRKTYWRRRSKEVRNCGYCVPCLIRRAAFHKVGRDAVSEYGLDVCAGEVAIRSSLINTHGSILSQCLCGLSEAKSIYETSSSHNAHDSADDFRAVLGLLRSGKTAADFEREMLTVAPVDRVAERAAMLERGFGEIRALLQSKGNKEIRRAAGFS